MHQQLRTRQKTTRSPLLLWLLASTVVLSACAQAPMMAKHPSAIQSPKRQRDAELVIKEFLGTYTVVDSRFNHKAFDKIVLELNDGIPTLKVFKGENLSLTITANDCAGDLINKFSNNKYLACFSSETGSRRQRSFRVSAIPVEETYKQGTLLSTMKPMVVHNGYLVIFDLGNAYESETAFSAKKL